MQPHTAAPLPAVLQTAGGQRIAFGVLQFCLGRSDLHMPLAYQVQHLRSASWIFPTWILGCRQGVSSYDLWSLTYIEVCQNWYLPESKAEGWEGILNHRFLYHLSNVKASNEAGDC